MCPFQDRIAYFGADLALANLPLHDLLNSDAGVWGYLGFGARTSNQ